MFEMEEGGEVAQKPRKPGVTKPLAASAAGKTLNNPKATAVEKEAAASALRQTPLKSAQGASRKSGVTKPLAASAAGKRQRRARSDKRH